MKSLSAWLVACSMLLSATLLSSLPARAAGPQPPIIDLHMHAWPWMTPEELVKRLDMFNVAYSGGGYAVTTPFSGGSMPEIERRFASAIGERFIRSTGLPASVPGGFKTLASGNGPEYEAIIQAMETDLREGARMIGEIHVNSFTWAPPSVKRKLSADGPFMQSLWALALKYDVPLMVHLELEDDTARQLENMLATADKKVILVLAHCGSFTGAIPVWRLMEKYPNLNCDLSNRELARSPNVPYGPERMIYRPDSIVPNWKKLIESYPDRFVVGTDVGSSWSEYEKTISTIRTGLLGQLTPETARKVAYENAARWLKIKMPMP